MLKKHFKTLLTKVKKNPKSFFVFEKIVEATFEEKKGRRYLESEFIPNFSLELEAHFYLLSFYFY